MCRACATSSFCPLCTPAQPSSCSTVVLSRSISLVVPLDCRGAPPVPCMQMCYRHLCSREHTLSASRAAGGESPLLCREVPRTSHKPRSSSGRGGTAPSESAPGATRPAQVPQLERPRRAYPPVSAPQVRHGTWYPSQHVLLGPASGSALVPDALPARTHTHTLRHPWACQCGTPVHLFHARIFTMRHCAPSDLSEEGVYIESD